MRLLVLGGTVFLGRRIAIEAVTRGHHVTLFHRGSNPRVPRGCEEVLGDRDRDLGALGPGSWDACVDTSGYRPEQVAAALAALGPRCGHWTFVSSVSAYGDLSRPGLTEDHPAADPAPRGTELSEEAYGPLKRACELELPAEALVVRPGIIAGPDDHTARFTYWARRGARSGRVLAPGAPGRPIQLIDVRDLAAWILDMAEAGTGGLFNAVSPPVGWGEMLAACGPARPVWAPDDWLLAHGVEPFADLPLWLPEGELPGFFTVDPGKAVRAGLAFRPLAETAAGALDEPGAPPVSYGVGGPTPGLSEQREARLLEALR
jgi:2'-hydroxyisoflavone reductase